MKFPRRQFLRLAASATALAAMTGPGATQTPNLAGKNVQVIIGSTTGGVNDLWGRAVARHLGKHLPGQPSVIPQNMPGAGGLNAVNYIYNTAPRNGTALANIVSSVPLGPLTGATGARFDSLKLTWVGTPTTQTYLCLSTANAKVKTFADLLTTELIVGTSGVGAGPSIYPKALNGLMGTKFKIVSGFPSASNVLLAMERNEVDGACLPAEGVLTLRPDWIANKKVNVLFQAGARPNSKLKGVPFILDLARTRQEKEAVDFLFAGNSLGRPFIAPPDMPAELIKMLRDAFNATMKDDQFIADAERQRLDVAPEDGEHLATLVKRIYQTPKPIIDKIGELLK